jgi:DNA-binding MarR family transcriptional regulator
MVGQAHSKETEQTRILLGLLESVSRDGTRSQRHLANDLDIALGLVNAYLRRCVNKGLVKVSQVPARRYAYYLTPKGFAEKSRLTVEFLTSLRSLQSVRWRPGSRLWRWSIRARPHRSTSGYRF